MRFSRTKMSGMVAVSATIMALYGAQTAVAQQFVPYTSGQNQGYSQYQAYAPQQAPPQYTAMAFQGSDTRTSNQPVETIGPGSVQGSAPMQNYTSAPTPGVNYAQPAPAPMSYGSYPPGGCASGTCGGYNTFAGGGCGVGAPYGGCDTGCGGGGGGYLGAGLGGRGCGRQWFGGFYGLYMERAGNDWVPIAFSTPTANVPPYYPADTEYVINLQDVNETTHGGAEVRLGATFGGGGGGCGPRHAWEVAYWGLLEEDETAQVFDLTIDANRLYGMIDFRGLEYDPGSGYRPVNDYYDYGPPTVDRSAPGPDVEIRSLTARSTFSAQNIEINLLRMPLLVGGGACGGCDAGGCGGCDSGGCGRIGRRRLLGRRGGGYGYAGPRYSVTTLVGARYLRFDEDFMYRTDFETIGVGLGTMTYNAEADNHLIGLQLGCNGIYHMGCSGRWALHCNANAGIFGNHMEVNQRFDVPTGGNLRYANGTNPDFDITAEDDDVAMIGEIRVGGSYQYSCKWRLFGGYRALGVSGVALSFEQIPSAFVTPAQTSYIDSNGSLFVHGLQGGVECTY